VNAQCRLFGPRRFSAALIIGAAVVSVTIDSQVIEIGGFALRYPVQYGDIVMHTFIHSMYEVPVIERFRIENGRMHLFHVDSESHAALEYYGIENRLENNVTRRIREFSIPVDSIGLHMLFIGNQAVSLSTVNSGTPSIRIRLIQQPAVVNWVNSLWR
jgi:hypothetical protein